MYKKKCPLSTNSANGAGEEAKEVSYPLEKSTYVF